MDLYLKNKTALITGGSQGLGKAIAKELALEGVTLMITARNAERLEALKQEILVAGGPEPFTFIQDFLAPDAPENIAKAALGALGHIDILINNTGQSRAVDPVGPEEPWRESMTLDFDRHRQLTQQLIPHFIQRNQGTILNITSTYELRSLNVSAIAKAAITAWSKQLAGLLGPYNIRVNCLQPGLIDTQNIRNIFTAAQGSAFAQQEIPLGAFGEPQDIANMAAFLVSPRARYITGSVSSVDGGLSRYAF